ncbi:hypothetical protein EC917_101320 [Bacillus thuringiensis]|uniref:Uncharacterized protein n=1 Tax=Bacillus thuringiensis TaxID=1428 RepID=A0A4R4BL67_BACTU|nr:hypothetical protein [Bacillus thuringiensis]MDA2281016.1 hypothetical protein [Bacillus cereus]TCW59066.1 hypothetical protein EC917_101320 [Bacillus thuringiensis]TCW59694.1 hypothetical protein EC910_101324 [Bacillus thuringiensis]
MEFYKVTSEGIWTTMKVIAANSKYEAVGYLVMDYQKEGNEIEEISVETIDRKEEIEWECIGFPVYKTLEEIYEEKEDKSIPCIVVGLIEN